ncbi:ABC transporter substrate-binding protein [Parasporobacterium paucivorans]|uniref:Branched-chain amino acid transport system substrate-binding protein n=1 Tax=Parasporobacterium paucivorans DSM 15970 TaxID=1122934 RepID=A0A1M6E4I2_9FIRM|nr:ABC transporter substrate-binding protein [Parasporobacterium paucivorans]SHI80293.1 branched-chain amino acid transport system substrate-binding protein [Parasporobacterium paucivorans DSM 15970]
MKKITRIFALLLSLILLVPAVLAGCGSSDETADKTEIVIGYVAPFTGPISAHTAAFSWVMDQAVAKINEDGGIYIKAYDKKLPIRVVTADSESSSTKASEVANKLVLDEKVDILAGAWTPDTSLPVAAVAERNQIPCLIENSPADSWLTGGPYEWSYGIMFYLDDLVEGYIDALDKLDTNKRVGYLFDSEVDGVTFSAMLNEKLPGRGYEIVDPGRFASSTTDYTNIITQLKNADCDIVIGNQITPNFTTAWQQFQQQGYVPKAMVVGKALQFYTDVAALGNDIGTGIMSERHWNRTYQFKSTLLGSTPEELATAWETEKKSEYPFTIGYDLAFFEVLSEALSKCDDLKPETIRDAIGAVDYEGIFGALKADEKHVFRAPIVTGQWIKSDTWGFESNIISNGNFVGISKENDPIFLPGYTVK